MDKKIFISLLFSLIFWLATVSLPSNNVVQTPKKIPEPFRWEYATPESQGFSTQQLDRAVDVLSGKGTKKLLIIRNDKIIYEWYASGKEGSESPHYTASLAKAIVSGLSLACVIDDDLLNLEIPACQYITNWKNHEVKSKITIQQLATHTSGLDDAEPDDANREEMIKKGLNTHFDLPGWKGRFWRKEPDPFSISRDSTPVLFTPGTKYMYSNPGIAMLNYAVTSALDKSPYQDIRTYLQDRIYQPIGIDQASYSIGYGQTYNVDGYNLVPGWGGGNFTARSIARIGLLMLHMGNWQGEQLLDSAAIWSTISYQGTALPVSTCEDDDPNPNIRISNNPIPATTAGWYSNFDGNWSHVPRDAFGGAGAGNQHLLVIPSLNMVIVRMGGDLYDIRKQEGFWMGAEKYLFNPIMDALIAPPYTRSPIAAGFPEEDSVIRMARGSDNWPVTWGNDDQLYTAYGDGHGFEPFTDFKLSLGIAKVMGNPPVLTGENIRSPTGERVGQGPYGPKASGMLMVDGTLYMLVRNRANSALMWSEDQGKTWKEADWKFETSFGCPTFLNYGKNYDGAIDHYVYIYSHDDNSAYNSADQFVLARVHRDHIKEWRKYEYFSGFGNGTDPLWSEDIRKRKSVFTHPANCYRSGITYNPGLRKFLWCQILPHTNHREGTRFEGGFGIYESSYPWGPWKTVFYTKKWDMGPGEMSSLPVKWMSDDGKEAYLLFSGDDYFSVRKINFIEQ